MMSVLNFLFFFFFLTFPYYFLLGDDYYVPKSNPAWGYLTPNTPEAWFFFALAFVFLAFWAATVVVLVWKRRDAFQRGLHPKY